MKRITAAAIDADGDAACMRRQADALRFSAHDDAYRFEDLANRLRHVGIFARGQARTPLDHGHLGTEATVPRGELETDVAAAHDHQVLGPGTRTGPRWRWRRQCRSRRTRPSHRCDHRRWPGCS